MRLFISIFIFSYFISFTAFAESEFILNSKAKKTYKETIDCIKLRKNNISKCLKETIVYFKIENKLLKISKNKSKSNKRKNKITKFLKKSTDFFVGKYMKNKNIKDYKPAINTTKVYYAVTKDEKYKKIIQELKSVKKGGSETKILIKLLTDNPNGEDYLKYIEEYNKRISYLEDNLRKDTLKYGENKINSYIALLNKTLSELELNSHTNKIDGSLTAENYKIAIKTKGINTKEKKISNLKKQIFDLINNNNRILFEDYKKNVTEFKSYNFKIYNNVQKDYSKSKNYEYNYNLLKEEFKLENYDKNYLSYSKNIKYIIDVMSSDLLRKNRKYVESFNLLYKTESSDESFIDTRNKVSQKIMDDINKTIFTVEELFESVVPIILTTGYKFHKNDINEIINNSENNISIFFDKELKNEKYKNTLRFLYTIMKTKEFKLYANKLEIKYYKSYNPYITKVVMKKIKLHEFKQSKKIISNLNKIKQTTKITNKLLDYYNKEYKSYMFLQAEKEIESNDFVIAKSSIAKLSTVYPEDGGTIEKLKSSYRKKYETFLTEREKYHKTCSNDFMHPNREECKNYYTNLENKNQKIINGEIKLDANKKLYKGKLELAEESRFGTGALIYPSRFGNLYTILEFKDNKFVKGEYFILPKCGDYGQCYHYKGIDSGNIKYSGVVDDDLQWEFFRFLDEGFQKHHFETKSKDHSIDTIANFGDHSFHIYFNKGIMKGSNYIEGIVLDRIKGVDTPYIQYKNSEFSGGWFGTLIRSEKK